jgi:chromosome segregation ATPase
MEKKLEQLNKTIQDNKKKVENLAEQIQSDKAIFANLDKDYQKIVLAGNDEEADKLFDRMAELKRAIERNERRYQVLNQPNNLPDEVKVLAKELLSEYEVESNKLYKLEKEKEAELEAFRETYFQKIEELGKITREQKDLRKYRAAGNKALDPKDRTNYFYEPADSRSYKLVIDNKTLIYQALQGTRAKGVTR